MTPLPGLPPPLPGPRLRSPRLRSPRLRSPVGWLLALAAAGAVAACSGAPQPPASVPPASVPPASVPPSSAPPARTSGPVPAVPAEFRAACGHPGAHVIVRKVPVTIPHTRCDLTGVAVSYPGYGGATVPREPGGIGNSLGFSLTVQPGTLDVTITATSQPGNA